MKTINNTFPNNKYFFPKYKSIVYSSDKQSNVVTNYFKFKFSSKIQIYKYEIQIEPKIQEFSNIRINILSPLESILNNMFTKYIIIKNKLFSITQISDAIILTTIYDGQEYTITISHSENLEIFSKEATSFYRYIINEICLKSHYININGSFYNSKSEKIDEYDLEVKTGFQPNLFNLHKEIVLNININYKIIRGETALYLLTTLIAKYSSNTLDIKEYIDQAFRGITVITKYNNRCYIIDSVDLSLSPLNSFNNNEGYIVSYLEYYKSKYDIDVHPNQPLLVHKKGDKIIHLIPELCNLVGLSDDMRNNYSLMNKIEEFTQESPRNNIEDSIYIINKIKDKGSNDLERWGIGISSEPVSIKANIYLAGNLEMYMHTINREKKRYTIDLENINDIERKFRVQMYSQPPINEWIIIYFHKDEKLIEEFLKNIAEIAKNINFVANEITKVSVKSGDIKDWTDTISNNVSVKLQMILCVIPGVKGKGQLYYDLKKYLITKIPVPSQLILTGTLTKPKGIQSIVNKILIQITAKIGGEPWIVDKLPFTEYPSMICSIYSKRNLNSLAIVSSYNKTFTKYLPLIKTNNIDLTEDFISGIEDSIINFSKINNIAPTHIIIFREGLEGGLNYTVTNDINCFHKAFQNFGFNEKDFPKITYIYLNRNTQVKLFNFEGKSYSNCQPGTVIDGILTDNDKHDFYMITQKPLYGILQPTYYCIAYDDKGINLNDLYILIHKLSYLYYNWLGPIKVPAPCQYSRKLFELIKDKLLIDQPIEEFENKFKSLYFI